jgi:hypothetical protein
MESNPIFNPEIGTQKMRASPTESDFRELVARILKRSPKDRQAIAMELSALTGERVTRGMLNDWLAPSKAKVRFPASFIRPLCEVLADDSLQRYVMGKRLRQLVRLGEIQIERETIRAELLKNGGRRRGKNKKR